MKHSMIILSILLLGCATAEAQFKFGGDIYSRYIWRGVDYGNAPSFQPAVTYTAGGFSVGTWAAYSIGSSRTDTVTGAATVFAEHDLWASYGLVTDAGTFTLLYTDYYYPSAGLKYFDFKGTGGAHVLELGAGYTGTESFPVSVTAYYNFHNDADKSVYIQASYPFTIEAGTLTAFVAGTPAKSAWYVSTDAAIINAGITLTRTVKLSETFSLPLTASYILNPHVEQSYLILGISL
ncbi:MAG: hypothetical protein HUU02_12640 [Bacteroidetes bacterium]|nr:hypothetical protein [Bacteroidota bacterium]